ncbi:MAG: hypothetical protein IT447_12490 [Phycisphaerales bacterium]|nr:hypothetical protein [Phycisphaerales bacterium]
MNQRMKRMGLGLGVTALFVVGGCAGRPALLPNPDPTLDKPSTVFAADAVKRFPYKSDAPRGGEAVARAQVGYTLNRLDIVNLSDEDWSDVEVWVNQGYVVHVPLMKAHELKRLNFQMLYNDNGQYFPVDNSKVLVKSVELYRDGKMYTVPVQLAD